MNINKNEYNYFMYIAKFYRNYLAYSMLNNFYVLFQFLTSILRGRYTYCCHAIITEAQRG